MPSPEVAACTRELVRELKALACAALARLDPAAESARQKAEATHGDPSVFDAFYYFNCPISEQARNINMGEWSVAPRPMADPRPLHAAAKLQFHVPWGSRRPAALSPHIAWPPHLHPQSTACCAAPRSPRVDLDPTHAQAMNQFFYRRGGVVRELCSTLGLVPT
jgi:hypothetical protein